jgi:hypothetical protein
VPICDALLPWLRGLPPGPVVQYRGKPLNDTKMMFDHLTARASRQIRREAAAAARTHRVLVVGQKPGARSRMGAGERQRSVR